MAPAVDDSGSDEDVDPTAGKLDNGASTEESDEDDEEEEEEEEEPRLEYTSMTRKLTSVYRNGDSTSTFLVAGDKMVSSGGRIKSAMRARKDGAEGTTDHWHS